MSQHNGLPGKDGRVNPDPYTVGHGLFRILGGGPGFMQLGGRRAEVEDPASSTVTAYLRPPWRQDLDSAISTYLAIDVRSAAGSLLYVQYAGPMDAVDLFREPSGTYRPSSFDPTRTATFPLTTGPATLTELPARLDDPVLVLQWSLCDHGLALAALATQYPEAELVRIAESVPERCDAR